MKAITTNKAGFDGMVNLIESKIRDNAPETRAAMNRAQLYTCYAIHVTDCKAAYYRASYRHTQKAEIYTGIIDLRTNTIIRVTGGHPRSHGVTKKNGWTIDPEYTAID